MRNLIKVLFFFSITLILLGLIMRYNDNPWGGFVLAIGFLGVFIYFLSKSIKNIVKGHFKNWGFVYSIITMLMSLVLFTKYLYWSFGDYIALLIVPLFIVISIFYIIKTINKKPKIITTIILFTLLIIPLFGFDFYPKPTQYIPKEWYDRYNSSKKISVTMPYKFETDKARNLSVKAFDLRKSDDFLMAIPLYIKAIEIEPKNPRLYFDISICYAEINQLEKAVIALDKAIELDRLNAHFYNNRGLLFSSLIKDKKAIVDFKKAISIDSTQWVYQVNLALSFNDIENFKDACLAIEKARKLGFDINSNKTLKRVKKKNCR